jgi:hypothetical protein
MVVPLAVHDLSHPGTKTTAKLTHYLNLEAMEAVVERQELRNEEAKMDRHLVEEVDPGIWWVAEVGRQVQTDDPPCRPYTA